MQLVNLRALLGLSLGFVATSAAVLSYFYKEHTVLILAVQAASLATIYSVGSNYVEHKIRKDYEDIIEHIESKLRVLNRNLYKAKSRILELENKGSASKWTSEK